jgi:hypothetical protein
MNYPARLPRNRGPVWLRGEGRTHLECAVIDHPDCFSKRRFSDIAISAIKLASVCR